MGSSAVETNAIARAVDTLQAGGTIMVLDGDSGLGNLGMVVMAAEHADAAALLRFSRLATGWSYLALTDQRCEALGLDLVAARDDALVHAPLTVTIRALEGVSTGVSLTERAQTIRVAIDPDRGRDDIRFGGNVLPLRARPGGVLERAGYTEASTDLMRIGELLPAAVVGEIVATDGSETKGDELVALALREGIPTVTIGEVIAHRRRTERLVRRIVSTGLATASGTYHAVGYLGELDDAEHMALVRGQVENQEDVLVYIHMACWEGDVFRSSRCDCRAKLDAAEAAIGRAGRGVLVHLAHPGYVLHQQRAPDEQIRDFGVGAQILADLGLTSITVLSDRARPLIGLEGYGLAVSGYAPLLATAP